MILHPPKTASALSNAILLAIILLALIGLFNALPWLDTAMSRQFCQMIAEEPDDPLRLACSGFPAARSPVLYALRMILFYLPPAALMILLANASWNILRDRRPGLMASVPELAAAYLIGPILIVNSMLKTFSGRPRPYESIEFGGMLPFVPAGDFSGLCSGNCSFASGEAAAAGWLLWVVALLAKAGRPRLAFVLAAAALATPALRVVMGGHYLSDAITGFLIGVASYPLAVMANRIVTEAGKLMKQSFTALERTG
ncbi:phosphatase PAP2 family protein [Rhizobium alvei]|uniref:Phosphatase PAP2 family protein n=1 Tax=Rhizobium alvei TaxID=1132659 RepID=A0ABT8YJN5_9HYPH|nr:phosphatase PAP2 family protein [Rhizobium alvei]MDO6963682.1 phosphatase PAP2 family protein [Rhizobium alvei]